MTAHQGGGGGFDPPGEDWRLGLNSIEEIDEELADETDEPPRDRSHERLTRPLQVVTVEHFSWALIALYTVATRLTALGARPLDGGEARHAIRAFDLTSGVSSGSGYLPYGGWHHLITAGLFGLADANDFTARLVYAFAGMLLVGTAFELRHYIGRAGALAFGAMLALSPGVTWFSRASAAATVAVALEVVTIALFMALTAQPSKMRAAAIGVAGGLMVAASPSGLVAAIIFVTALAIVGLFDLVIARNRYLGIRVWLDRYAPMLVTVIVAAAISWGISQMIVPDGFDPARLSAIFPVRPLASFPETRTLLPVIALEDFLIAIAAVIGVGVILALRLRSRFAAWSLLWLILSAGYYLALPAGEGRIQNLMQLLVPAALVGAIGMNWLHRSEAWPNVRIPIAALALLTLYASLVANFARATPDASEAPWNRHGSLFWGGEATTEQARLYARRAAAGLTPAAATVYFDGPVPAAIRWYLRELRPVDTVQAASVIVTARQAAPNEEPSDMRIYRFAAVEHWAPDYATLSAGRAIRFVLTGAVWNPGTFDEVTVAVKRAAGSAPAAILMRDNQPEAICTACDALR